MTEENLIQNIPNLILRQSIILLFWGFIISLWFIFTPFYVPLITYFVSYHFFVDGLYWGQVPRKFIYVLCSVIGFGAVHTGLTKLIFTIITSKDQLQGFFSDHRIYYPAGAVKAHVETTFFYAITLLLTIGGEKRDFPSNRKRNQVKNLFYVSSFLILILPIILTLFLK
jgi:hypothetical protein